MIDPYETYVNGYYLFEVKAFNKESILIIAKSIENALAITKEYFGEETQVASILVSDKYILLQK